MDSLEGSGLANTNSVMKKPRSITVRRPRQDSNSSSNSKNHSLEDTPVSNSNRSGFRKREFFLNTPPPVSNLKKSKRAERLKRSTEGVLSPANWKGSMKIEERESVNESIGESSKLRKVKVKVGGVTRTIHAKSDIKIGDLGVAKQRQKGENYSKEERLQQVVQRASHSPSPSPSPPLRKSNRPHKSRVLDPTRYLQYKKIITEKEENQNTRSSTSKKKRRKGTVSDAEEGSWRSGGTDSDAELEGEGEEEEVSDGGVRGSTSLTARQKAMQSGKRGGGFVEFPEGLPPLPSRKQKGKLSEVEIQAKKAEAAQRRRMQVEKAARESEAEAIRKILGLDSDKKKEEKKQKEKEEKERVAKSQKYTGSTIRWVMGPTGTVVTFPDDLGLPFIFNSKPHSYPPPREKCAGPLCNNTYRYRDSKSNLPICSLQCYKSIQGNA